MQSINSINNSYIGKEKEPENNLGDHGVRKYDYETGRFNSIDPLFEKYYGWSPYQYSMNNPIWAKDWNGENAVKVVDDVNKVVTINAVYIYNTAFTDGSDIRAANNFLNSQNYSVTEGEFAGYQVKFNLVDVPNLSEAGVRFKEDFNYDGTNIGNTYSVQSEFKWSDKQQNQRDFTFKNGKAIGGVTLESSDIIMNSTYNNKRRAIHEIFHTFFFNRDDAESGIGNYKPGTDMPNQDDINALINNPNLERK